MTENVTDVQLCYSRDGVNFKRFEPGKTWFKRGKPGSWNQYMINIPNPPIEVGDEIYIYYSGSKNHHDWWITGLKEGLNVPEASDLSKVGYALGLARMKRDRYVSLSAFDVRDGVIVTKPFHSRGRRLVINARCRPGGSIQVEAADKDGKPLKGFERENCTPFTGDSVTHTVKWKGKTNIPKRSKLHFYMKDADLFTFEFTK